MANLTTEAKELRPAKEAVVVKMNKSGYPTSDICKAVSLPDYTIWKIYKKYNLTPVVGDFGVPMTKGEVEKLSPVWEQRILERQIARGWSIQQMAAWEGIGSSKIRQKLTKYGLTAPDDWSRDVPRK